MHWNLRLSGRLPRAILSPTSVRRLARGGSVHGSSCHSTVVHTRPRTPVSSCPVPAHARRAGARAGRGLRTGVVVDEAGAAVAGARVTVRDGNGAVVQTVASDQAGTFSLRGLLPGTYSVLVEMSLFSPVTQRVTVPASGSVTALRAVLKAGGFAESVVVTARRVETRIAETPQKIDVVDAADIERTVAADLTDVLKKNAGVDVVQYTGALSGIGIRGFRPQTSGINKRSLLLVDGRPAGVTNLATLLLDNVDRIEVLKGAASAVYGSSAMGGVVNVLTRQSRGQIGGTLRLGAGSFGTTEVAGRTGGSLASNVDFDATGSAFDQRDDIRMGNGVTRPSTKFKTYAGTARVGVDLHGDWRIEGRGDVYRGRDISTPPDIAAGTVGQGRKNIERNGGDARVTGRVRAHALSIADVSRDGGQPQLQRHVLESGRSPVLAVLCRSKAICDGPAFRPRTPGTGPGGTASSSVSTTRRSPASAGPTRGRAIARRRSAPTATSGPPGSTSRTR